MSILGKIRNRFFVMPIVNSIKQEIPGILQRIQGNRAEQIQDLRIVLHQELPKILKSDCLTVDTFFSTENQQNDVQNKDNASFTDKLDEVSEKVVIKTDAEIRKMLSKRSNFSYDKNSIEPKKQCSIFASYSSSGIIEEYVIYYLKELRKLSDYIIFIADNDIKDKREFEKIKELVDFASFGRHGQYDFGSWKIGYEYLTINNLLDKFDNFLLVNDSCYGPVFSLKDIYETMNKKNVDFWGLCDSYDLTHHIQSFFINCSKKVFNSETVKMFFYSLPQKMEFWEAVTNGELRFTYLLEKHFVSGAYLPKFCKENSRGYIAGTYNATIWPLSLLKQGFPLIKVKALTGGFNKDLREPVSDVLSFVYKNNKKLYEIIINDLIRRCGTFANKRLHFSPNATDLQLAFSNQKVISFDIFDTLLVMPFVNPTELFRLMEVDCKCEGFYEERIKAERRARANVDDAEITFDDIYKNIKPEYKHLKDVELEYEYRLLAPNPATKSLYEQAKTLCKTIIATSDMYLPKEFLRKVLDKNGYSDISNIFVSSEFKHAKGSLELCKGVLSKLNLEPHELMHICGNVETDNAISENLGITCHTIENLANRFDIPGNFKWMEFYKHNPVLNRSIHLMRLACNQFSELSNNVPYWQMLGYRLGGPLVLSYLQYILKEAKKNKIDKILFVARDGWVLKNIYTKYFYEDVKIPCDYVHFQCLLEISSMLDCFDDPNCLRKTLEEYKRVDSEIAVTDDYDSNKIEFYKNQTKINEYFSLAKEEFEKHIKTAAGDASSIAIVGTNTTHFSSLRIAKMILEDKVALGFFMGAFSEETKLVYSVYLDRLLTKADKPLVTLAEVFCSSPETNIVGLQNEDAICTEEKSSVRKDNCMLIAKGIESYVEESIKIFGKQLDGISFSMEEWMDMAMHYKNLINIVDIDCLKTHCHTDLFMPLYDLLYKE